MHKPIKPEPQKKEEPRRVEFTQIFRIQKDEVIESKPIPRKRVIKREEMLKPQFTAILIKWFNHLRKFKKITQLVERIKVPEPTEEEMRLGNAFNRRIKELERMLNRELNPEEKIAIHISSIIRRAVNIARNRVKLKGFTELKDFLIPFSHLILL